MHSPNLLEDGYDLCTIQELLGHKDVATTMICTHVLNRGGKGVRSPTFDNLLITRDLTERSARFYTEENLGRRVYTEPDIHCWAVLVGNLSIVIEGIFMNHFKVIIATALFCVAVSARAQTSIKPASIYDQDGITVVSPNQPGWILLKTDKSEMVFEKRAESGILNASVKAIRTKTFETDKERLAGWETLKQEELSKLKRDSIHFDIMGFKGAMCLRYTGIFPIEKTSSSNFAYFNLKGYLCPRSNAKDSAVQMEFSNYSNTRGLTEDLYSLSEEFFEKLTFPKRQ